MPKVINHSIQFYKQLASLFYAVAAADKNIVIEEKQAIKEEVEQHWSFTVDHMDTKKIIFSTLNKLIKSNYDQEEAFLDFKRFFLKHAEEFPEYIRIKILEAAESIAFAFAKRNKSESILISRLYFLFFK